MKKVNLHEAKTNLSKLVELASKGEDVVICKAGVPVAKLIAFNIKKEPRVAGAWANKVVIKDDFDTLPEEFMSYFK